MNADGQVRFNALVSSSEESDDDRAGDPNSSSEEEGEIRRKRFKVDAPAPKPEAPKWSNPDPYSALPPTENIGAPKKDIVQVIRKAKNASAPKTDMSQGAAQNADFISFTFEDDVSNDQVSIAHSDGYRSGPSPRRSPSMSGEGSFNRNHTANGDDMPPLPLKRSARDRRTAAPRPQPIDLTDSGDDLPPRKSRKRQLSPIDLTSDNEGPPSPPTGFVMPTDEELMQQYVGQPAGKKRKHNEQSIGKGDITEAWTANWTDPTPWCTPDRQQASDTGIRFVGIGLTHGNMLTHL